MSEHAHVFFPILINSQVHRTKTSTTYLIFDYVLIDVVLGLPIRFIILVPTFRIECFFYDSDL